MRRQFGKAYRCLVCSRRFFLISTWRVLGVAATIALVVTLLALMWPA